MPFFTKTIRKFFCLVFFTTILTPPFFCFSAIQEEEPFKIPIPKFEIPPSGTMTKELYEQIVKSTPLVRSIQGQSQKYPVDLKEVTFDHSHIGHSHGDFEKGLPKTPGSIFDFCNLKGAVFNPSLLPWSPPPLMWMRFIRTDLSKTFFSELTLQGNDFTGAILSDTVFSYCQIQFSRFRGVNFNNANFQWACFEDCKLIQISRKGARFQNATFKRCEISKDFYEFLETVKGVDLEDCTVVS